MPQRHEISDSEWERIKDLLPPENTGEGAHPGIAFIVGLTKFKQCYPSSFHATHRFSASYILYLDNHRPYAA